MLKSLLSTFTHITYKGALSQGICYVRVNSVLKLLLSTFTRLNRITVDYERRTKNF